MSNANGKKYLSLLRRIKSISVLFAFVFILSSSNSFALEGNGSTLTTQPQKTQRMPKWKLGLSISLLSIGAIVAGIGTYALAIDGTCASSIEPPAQTCPSAYNTRDKGATMVGFGSLGVIGGILGLAIPESGGNKTVDSNKLLPVDRPFVSMAVRF